MSALAVPLTVGDGGTTWNFVGSCWLWRSLAVKDDGTDSTAGPAGPAERSVRVSEAAGPAKYMTCSVSTEEHVSFCSEASDPAERSEYAGKASGQAEQLIPT